MLDRCNSCAFVFWLHWQPVQLCRSRPVSTVNALDHNLPEIIDAKALNLSWSPSPVSPSRHTSTSSFTMFALSEPQLITRHEWMHSFSLIQFIDFSPFLICQCWLSSQVSAWRSCSSSLICEAAATSCSNSRVSSSSDYCLFVGPHSVQTNISVTCRRCYYVVSVLCTGATPPQIGFPQVATFLNR